MATDDKPATKARDAADRASLSRLSRSLSVDRVGIGHLSRAFPPPPYGAHGPLLYARCGRESFASAARAPRGWHRPTGLAQVGVHVEERHTEPRSVFMDHLSTERAHSTVNRIACSERYTSSLARTDAGVVTVFFKMPIRTIALIGAPPARYNRRISAQPPDHPPQ